MTSSQKTVKFGTDCVPTIGTKIRKDFGSKGYFEGEVVSGPHNVVVEGDNMVVWKVRYEDDDCEEMTASEIAHWKAPVEEDGGDNAVWGSVGRTRRCSSKTGKGRQCAYPFETIYTSPTTSARNGVHEFPR